MTSEPWSSMTDRERDAALATLLGMSSQEEETYWPNTELVWRDKDGMKVPAPTFTTSLDAMRLVEDEIEQRGLQEVYIRAFVDILEFPDIEVFDSAIETNSPHAPAMWDVLWQIAHATPAQRAEAAWRVLRGE